MSYVGCLVSLNCGQSLGIYQGQVLKVDNSSQTLTLCRPFRNGVKCEVPEVTISACDIKELKIVKSADEAQIVLPKNVTPSKLSKQTADNYDIVASPGRVVEAKANSNSQNKCSNGANGHGQCKSTLSNNHRDKHSDHSRNHGDGSHATTKDRLMHDNPVNGNMSPTRDRDSTVNGNGYRTTANRDKYEDNAGGKHSNRDTPTKDDQFRGRMNSASEVRADRHKGQASMPRKIEFRKKAQNRQDCFSAPVDSLLDEFDFEKNLALFDKKAVFEEIESNNPDIALITDKKPTKYRCDENVLQTKPATYQQIKVPREYGKPYVTDSGLVVPTIDYELRNKMFDVADACGYTIDRRLEMIGRSSSEMVLQLLGGSSRLNPQNGHQLPTVIVLCGPHVQGAQGLNCARHLLNHGVRTIVFLPNFLRMVQCVELELRMYEMCNGKRYCLEKDVPTCSIDMIINCMDSHENSFLKEQAWYETHVNWVKQCRAPVFTIDPPIETVAINPKWCLYPVLPLAKLDMTSQMYLCDLGLPKKVYKEAGLTYKSPFGHKFIIALHPDSA